MQYSTGGSFQSIFTFDCFPTHFLNYSVGELDGKGWFFCKVRREYVCWCHPLHWYCICLSTLNALSRQPLKIYLFAQPEHQTEQEGFLQCTLHPGCITLAGDHLLSVLRVQQSPSVLPEVRCLNHPRVRSEHRIYDKDHFRLECW